MLTTRAISQVHVKRQIEAIRTHHKHRLRIPSLLPAPRRRVYDASTSAAMLQRPWRDNIYWSASPCGVYFVMEELGYHYRGCSPAFTFDWLAMIRKPSRTLINNLGI
jgi:hypothetical protein